MKTSMILLLAASASLLSASAHAAKGSGPDQDLVLKTSPRMSASCEFHNAVGAWTSFTTPEHISIMKAPGKFTVRCVSADGRWEGDLVGTAQQDGFGGLESLPYAALTIGSAAVSGDINDPANFSTFVKYGDVITVPLHQTHPDIASARPATDEEIAESMQGPSAAQVSTASGTVQRVHHHRHHVIKHVACAPVAHLGS